MLILLMWVKLDAFFALLITSFAVGALAGMEIGDVLQSVLKGVGGTMGNIILILTFGAMLGKLIEESGAAHTITHKLTDLFGVKNIHRITSYNVCYTKLLRSMVRSAMISVLQPLCVTRESIPFS